MPKSRAARALGGVLAAIGGTPMVQLSRLVPPGCADVFVKLEFLNPGGSVKDRAALAVIRDAEDRGVLKPGGTVIEPTSGNMGPALCMVGAALGYRVVIVTPSDASEDYRRRLTAYGAEIVESPSLHGMAGSVEMAMKLVGENPDFFLVDQFANPASIAAHREGTGAEVLRDLAGRRLDTFVAGVGTGATITGVAQTLKTKQDGVRIVAVEPARSPTLSQGVAGPHRIAGIGANFLPAILDRSLIDEVLSITDEDAYSRAASLAKEEGLFVGPSSGANVAAAIEVGVRIGAGGTVVTVLCDSWERYSRSSV